ncbi:MAG TPA: DUF4962 domain-containing protein [Candidatus Korarchaeota archaeon]|nr:DUF4962 domain-containing protein [Candidatus Korarchaeota archaeon]
MSEEDEVGSHPYLFLNLEDINLLRNRLQDEDFNRENVLGITFYQIWNDIIAFAEESLKSKTLRVYEGTEEYPEGYDISLIHPEQPPRHTFRHPFWTGMSRRLVTHMINLALAYRLVGKEEYLERCKSMVLSICEWRNWSDPDYPTPEKPLPCCLDTWSFLSSIALIYDLLYDCFIVEEQKKIRKAMVEKGMTPIYEYALKKGTWLYSPEKWPNGYAMVHAGLGIGALSIFREDKNAWKWVEFEKEKTEMFLDREVGPDGGMIEGLGYGSAAISALLKFMVAYDRVTVENFTDHPSLRKVMLLALYTLAPDGHTAVNFCDAGNPEGCEPAFNLLMAYLAAVKMDSYAQWYMAETGLYKRDWGWNNLFRLLWFNPYVKPKRPDDLPHARFFRYPGWVVMRSGWRRNDILVAFKCGPYRGHGHADQNSFIINCSGEWLLNDKGYQRYLRPYPSDTPWVTPEKITLLHSFSHDTIGHNCILVDGEGQQEIGGEIVEFEGWNFGATVVGDASKSYPALKKALRRLTFIEPGSIIVQDFLESRKPRTFSFLLHTTKGCRIKVDGKRILIDGDKSSLNVYFLKPKEIEVDVKTYPYPHLDYTGFYLEVKNVERAEKEEFLVAMKVRTK